MSKEIIIDVKNIEALNKTVGDILKEKPENIKLTFPDPHKTSSDKTTYNTNSTCMRQI